MRQSKKVGKKAEDTQFQSPQGVDESITRDDLLIENRLLKEKIAKLEAQLEVHTFEERDPDGRWVSNQVYRKIHGISRQALSRRKKKGQVKSRPNPNTGRLEYWDATILNEKGKA